MYHPPQPYHPPSPESQKRGFNDGSQDDDDDGSQMDYYTQEGSQTDEQQSKKRLTTEDKIIDISDIMEGHLSQTMITDQNPKEISLGFVNSILAKFRSLITSHFRTPQISESPSISSPPPDIKSLITLEISGHSGTTLETYEQNYLKTNEQFRTILGTIYDNGILIQYRTLFNTVYNKAFVFAVGQGSCSFGDNMNYKRERFKDKLSRDAENRLIMYEKSKDFLRSIQERHYLDNRFLSEQYILDIKDTLNKLELSRYTNDIIGYYKDIIFNILLNIDVLIGALNYIQSIPPNDPIILKAKTDVETYKYEFNDLLEQLDEVLNEKDPITKITEFHKIIQQSTLYPIKWGTDYMVNEDIYKLILLHKIIVDVLLINSKILTNIDFKKQISKIDNIFKKRISKSVEQNLPLFLKSSLDKILFYDGILKHSFWRSEIHSLSHYDTIFSFMPEPDELPKSADYDYGLNIFALMLNLNASSQTLILPKTEVSTRATHQLKQIQFPGASGPRLIKTSMWRKHNLKNPELHILDIIVNIFEQNWFGNFGNLQGTDLALFMFIKNTLDNAITNIKLILYRGKIRIVRTDELEYNSSFIRILEEIADTDPNNPLRFTYCRVIEFTHFLTQILIGKQEGTSSRSGTRIQSSKKTILLSELIYLFQYLLQFDYVTYFISSCRGLEEGQVPNKLFRYGGNKRKTLKRKTIKRKTYKRKTYNKRKTLKRKR